MRSFTGSLGFRLTLASYAVVAVFMSVAGALVYRASKDSIKMGAMSMIQEMADDLQPALARGAGAGDLGEVLARRKALRTGSAWVMDREGRLLYNTDPLFRDEYAKNPAQFGNITVSLQAARPRPASQGGYKKRLVEIAGLYEDGFGTYKQFGKERIVAFRTLPAAGLLIGVDEPVETANSELDRIKRYVSYTGLVSAVLIMVFNLLAIHIIIRPYYRELEDLNASLRHSNERLEDLNARLTVSNRNLTVLYEVGLGMRHSLALRDILDLIVRGAQGVVDVDRIAIFVPDADGASLECRAAAGLSAADTGALRVPLSPQGGALAAAFQHKEPVRLEEGQRMPASYRLAPPWSEVAALRSRAFLAVPLVVKDRAVGVIAVDNKVRRQPIGEDRANLLGIFANQAAVAVENARLYDQLRQKIRELDARVDQLSILHQIGNSMQRVITRQEALGFITRGVFEAAGFAEVVVALREREGETLRGEIGLGVPEDAVRGLRVPFASEGHLLSLAAVRRAPVGVVRMGGEGLLDALARPLQEGTFRESVGVAVEGATMAALAVPLIAREEIVGVIAVGRREPPLVRRSEVELLLLFANTAGLTVERAELYARLHRSIENLEVTDQVSRLLTLRRGLQLLQESLAAAVTDRRPFSALMVGFDGFQAYNDRWGLEAGDRALAELGEIIKGGLGAGAFAFRYGGRIMAVGLPGAGREDASRVADGILSHVRRHRFAGAEGARDQILTVSIGLVAHGPGAVPAAADLFRALLQSLRRAEGEGGDRTAG